MVSNIVELITLYVEPQNQASERPLFCPLFTSAEVAHKAWFSSARDDLPFTLSQFPMMRTLHRQ